MMTLQPAAPAVAGSDDAPEPALFALGLAGFCAFLGLYATQPILPLLERVFGATKAEAALTVSAPTIAVALASPFSGFVANKYGHRRVIVAALLLLPAPMLLAATAPSVPSLVAWRFLQGLIVPGVYAVTMAFLAEEWPAGGLGRAMSALVTGNVIGGFSGRLLSGLAAEQSGWRASFVVVGAVTALGGWLAVPLLPRARVDHRAGREPSAPISSLLGDVLREPRLLATFAVGASVLFTLVATFTYVTFHLAAPPFSLGTGALSWLFSVYLIGAAVTPFAGRWIDRVGSRRAIRWSLTCAIGGGLLTLSPSLGLVVAGLAVTCTSVFASQAASTTYLREAAPSRVLPAVSGLYVSSYYVGGAFGGLVPALAWRLGGWTACVLLVACVQVVTIAIASRYWTRR
jgi:MFS family permease